MIYATPGALFHALVNEGTYGYGDLQDALRLAWSRLSDGARWEVFKEFSEAREREAQARRLAGAPPPDDFTTRREAR